MSDSKLNISAPTDDNDIFDRRLQHRFVTKGNWSFEQVTDAAVSLPDLESQVKELGPPQPAIGLFDEETLLRVQKNFPYNR